MPPKPPPPLAYALAVGLYCLQGVRRPGPIVRFNFQSTSINHAMQGGGRNLEARTQERLGGDSGVFFTKNYW